MIFLPSHCMVQPLGILFIFYFQVYLSKSIILKSHEPDKNLTYSQRCLKKDICNLSQQQLLLSDKLHAQNSLSCVWYNSLALQSESAFNLNLLLLMMVLFLLLGAATETTWRAVQVTDKLSKLLLDSVSYFSSGSWFWGLCLGICFLIIILQIMLLPLRVVTWTL